MTEESEKAANWEMVEQFKHCKAHLATLENEMKNIGESWIAFGRYLQNPCFRAAVTEQKITIVNELSHAVITTVSINQVSWEALVRLVQDYENTKNEKDSLLSKLRNLGVPLS
ncbi:MAG: hypothetical protein ACLP1Y_08360 [Candidatus Acidiferrales bacterium]